MAKMGRSNSNGAHIRGMIPQKYACGILVLIVESFLFHDHCCGSTAKVTLQQNYDPDDGDPVMGYGRNG